MEYEFDDPGNSEDPYSMIHNSPASSKTIMSHSEEEGAGPEYVLGTGADELSRLGFQHQVWAEYTARLWEDAGFTRGQELLDVGCGPGNATLELARLVGAEGRVTGVDVSPRFVAHLQERLRSLGIQNVGVRLEDLASLSQPAESIDGAFARWVLCFVTDPQAVIDRVATALRPGGTFAVLDYCNYEAFTIAPPSQAFDRIIRAVSRSFRKHGGNPDIGSELPRMMRKAGLEVRSIVPIVRSARPASALWQWPATFFANYLPVLVEMGEITAAERREFERDWRDRSEDSTAFFLSPYLIALVASKPG